MTTWRTTLQQLLTETDLATQGEVVDALRRRGHAVTQATISRELQTLGVRKRDGSYRLPPPAELPAPVHAVALAYGGGLAVVRTEPAHAAVLARLLDAAGCEGLLGTVAGDDTVLCVLARPDAFACLCRVLAFAPQGGIAATLAAAVSAAAAPLSADAAGRSSSAPSFPAAASPTATRRPLAR